MSSVMTENELYQTLRDGGWNLDNIALDLVAVIAKTQDAKTLKAVGEWLKKYQLEDDEIQGIVGGVHIPNCDAGLQVLMRGEMPGTPEGG